MMGELKLGRDGNAILIENDGVLISHMKGYYRNQKGEEIFASFAPVAGTTWSIILNIPTAQIEAVGNSMRGMILIISLIIGIIVVITVIIMLMTAMKPLQVVRTSIEHIDSGDADLTQTLEVHSNNEIGALDNGFNRFLETR